MRALRRQKSRALVEKVTSLDQAIRQGVKSGGYMAFGGLGEIRTPMAAVYEIIRQGIGDLTIATKGSQHDWYLLLAAGLITRIDASYGFADEIRGLSAPARRAVESGRARVIAETTNAGFQWRFKAAAMGLPFFPARTALGTDTLHHSGSKVIEDPFTHRPIELLPACYPDVAIIHVHRADRFGNCQIDGNVMEDMELAHAAKHLIVTTERLIPESEVRRQPDRTVIPYFMVDALVEVPYGAHPGNMPLLYSFDEAQWRIWLDASLTDEGVAGYFATYVREVADFDSYLQRVGGLSRLRQLERIEAGLDPYPPVATRRAMA